MSQRWRVRTRAVPPPPPPLAASGFTTNAVDLSVVSRHLLLDTLKSAAESIPTLWSATVSSKNAVFADCSSIVTVISLSGQFASAPEKTKRRAADPLRQMESSGHVVISSRAVHGCDTGVE